MSGVKMTRSPGQMRRSVLSILLITVCCVQCTTGAKANPGPTIQQTNLANTDNKPTFANRHLFAFTWCMVGLIITILAMAFGVCLTHCAPDNDPCEKAQPCLDVVVGICTLLSISLYITAIILFSHGANNMAKHYYREQGSLITNNATVIARGCSALESCSECTAFAGAFSCDEALNQTGAIGSRVDCAGAGKCCSTARSCTQHRGGKTCNSYCVFSVSALQCTVVYGQCYDIVINVTLRHEGQNLANQVIHASCGLDDVRCVDQLLNDYAKVGENKSVNFIPWSFEIGQFPMDDNFLLGCYLLFSLWVGFTAVGLLSLCCNLCICTWRSVPALNSPRGNRNTDSYTVTEPRVLGKAQKTTPHYVTHT